MPLAAGRQGLPSGRRCVTLARFRLGINPNPVLKLLRLSGRWAGPARSKTATAFLLCSALLAVWPAANGRQADRSAAESARSQDVVALAELPAQALTVYRSIYAGDVFRHDKDGAVFGNRERLLPVRFRGFYREYTVPTPGARDRGARRLVCGGPPRTPEVCYYTADHYASFRRVLAGPMN